MERYEMDTIKMEKEKAMRRYRTFNKIANVVRTVEIIVAIMLISFSISWTSSCVPSLVKFFGAFFRRVSSVFLSPHFVFLIGNAIIITLFANFSSSEKSGDDDTSSENADVNANSENTANVAVDQFVTTPPSTAVAVKEMAAPAVDDVEEVVVPAVEEEMEIVEKVYRRTKSAAARMEGVKAAEKEKEVLITAEVSREIIPCEVPEKAAATEARRRFEEDELSNDEFRRKVEQFIEKQQRFLREESKAVVLSDCNNFVTAASKYSRSRSM